MKSPLVPVAVDDIPSILNPSQQADLYAVLCLTLPQKRIAVTLAWTGLTMLAWAHLSGLFSPEATQVQTQMMRWFHGPYRMPLGAAARLSAVLGMPIRILFAEQVDQGTQEHDGAA